MKLPVSYNKVISRLLAPTTLAILCTSPVHAQVASRADMTVCVQVFNGKLNDFMQNNCPFPITVSWVDEGYCGGTCSTDVSPQTRASVTRIQGRVSWVACVYGRISHTAEGRPWRGPGRGHVCY